jgi:NitT/TauT family transport system substrate-binding protein
MSKGQVRVVEAIGGHGTFYIPQYAALELGVYEAEGIQVSLDSIPWKDGERYIQDRAADVLIAAPMRTMRLFEITGQRVVSFAEFACQHPFYILAKKAVTGFTWTDLKGKRLINFGEAETPIVCLRYVFNQHGIRCDDVHLIDGLRMPEAIEAFQHGYGDFLLQPADTTQSMLADGTGFLAERLASGLGRIPFTSYGSTPEFLKDNGDDLHRFVRGFTKTVAWLTTHPASEIAMLMAPYFQGMAHELLTQVLEECQRLELWPKNPRFSGEDFEHYKDVLVQGGWLRGTVNYGDVVSELS